MTRIKLLGIYFLVFIVGLLLGIIIAYRPLKEDVQEVPVVRHGRRTFMGSLGIPNLSELQLTEIADGSNEPLDDPIEVEL